MIRDNDNEIEKKIIIRPRNLLSKALSHLSPKAINKSLCQKASFLPYYFVDSAVQFRSERGQKIRQQEPQRSQDSHFQEEPRKCTMLRDASLLAQPWASRARIPAR